MRIVLLIACLVTATACTQDQKIKDAGYCNDLAEFERWTNNPTVRDDGQIDVSPSARRFFAWVHKNAPNAHSTFLMSNKTVIVTTDAGTLPDVKAESLFRIALWSVMLEHYGYQTELETVLSTLETYDFEAMYTAVEQPCH